MEQWLHIAGYVKTALGILASFGIVVQISPIKINPVSWLFNWLGKTMNKELETKIDNMQKQIDEISNNQDQQEIDTIRHRILGIEALIRKGEHLKRYQYDSVFKDIDKWIWFHEKYPHLNGMIDVAIENIREAYKKEKFDI